MGFGASRLLKGTTLVYTEAVLPMGWDLSQTVSPAVSTKAHILSILTYLGAIKLNLIV